MFTSHHTDKCRRTQAGTCALRARGRLTDARLIALRLQIAVRSYRLPASPPSVLYVLKPAVTFAHDFVQARGDVPSLAFVWGSGFGGTVAHSASASLEGIAPVWGTFELQHGGKTTVPLYVDASAGGLEW